MRYSSNFLKAKIFAVFFAIAAFSASAGEGNMNYYGQLGVHKTQSAQTLGHGRFGVGVFLEGANLENIIEKKEFCELEKPACYGIVSGDYLGGNGYPFLSLGLSNYFDFSVGIPFYGEYLKIKGNPPPPTNDLWAVGRGNLFISTKLRVPFNESFPLDFALLAGLGISTGTEDNGNANDYGPWVRDPMFLGTSTDNPISAGKGTQSTYSNGNYFVKLGIATTFDFGKIKTEIPLMLHFNYTYRMTLGEESEKYLNVHSISTAMEWTPIKLLSFFGEYYKDIPIGKLINESSTDLSAASFGTSFHLGKTVDLQLGGQIFTGKEKKYIDSLTINMGEYANDSRDVKASYSARLIPKYMVFGGLTVKLFTVEEPEKEEEKEYRNPDTDEDGVCDPWVAETGRQREFSSVCKGIDLCPYEQGLLKDKGCPVEEKEIQASAAPVIIFTAMPDVVQKGQSVTLSWQVSNATKVSIDGIGEVPIGGSKKVKPNDNTVFTLTAVGDGGTQTATTEVEVAAGPLPTILFSANPETVQIGQPVTLKWQITNATEASIEGIGKIALKGSKQVKPTESTVFTLTATGEGGTQTETAEVEVTAAPVIEARVKLQGVTFGSGNATLTPNAKKVLDGVAEQLLANPKVKIEIQGHTDNQGKPATNLELSERRAKSVVGYLATKGVKMSNMRAVGYGQDIPIADNKTSEGRELNRRIEMIRVDD